MKSFLKKLLQIAPVKELRICFFRAGPRLSEAPGEIDLGAPHSSKIIYRGSATLFHVNRLMRDV